MSKYIDAEKLRVEIKRRMDKHWEGLPDADSPEDDWTHNELCELGAYKELEHIEDFLDSLQQEQDKMRYCIEYINPQYPLSDNGLNIRHLRIPDEHSAEMALTLMLSFGAKIYALYRGNVKDGKLGEWPTPMIVDTDDWYSVDWLHHIMKDYPYVPGWRLNKNSNKPRVKTSVLMLTKHGIAEGEWEGSDWVQYRWSCIVKDTDVLYWIHLEDLSQLEKEGDLSFQQDQLEVDLKAEIEMEWDSFNKHVAEYGEESEEVVWLNWLSFVDIANYFYELGLKAKEDDK